MLDHAGELDDAFELKLAPAATNPRTLERIHQTLGFAPELFACRVERRDPLQQLPAILQPPPFGVADLAIDLIERPRDRGQQVLDRFLASVNIGGRRRARLAEARFGE